MRIALMTASFLDRSWQDVLDLAAQAGVDRLEACGGGHIPTTHFDPVRLAGDKAVRNAFVAGLQAKELSICALSCHGNPLDPNVELADSCDRDFTASCQLASELGVEVVNLLAGCPGGGPDDSVPNWIIPSVVPDFRDAYRWQWDERVLPYWQRAAETAAAYGVKVAIEPHPATVVYNWETFARLRAEIGPIIGLNYDHSHLWWQGVEPQAFIEAAGSAIFTVHIKDIRSRPTALALKGVLSAADYDEITERPWYFATAGYGHSDSVFAGMIMALRAAGYEDTLSIECEDPLLSPDDSFATTVDLLRRLVPRAEKPRADWAAVATTPRDARLEPSQ